LSEDVRALDTLCHWQKPKLVRRLEVRCGMQNWAPVHPAMKCLQALAPSIRLLGWGYRRTVGRT